MDVEWRKFSVLRKKQPKIEKKTELWKSEQEEKRVKQEIKIETHSEIISK